MDAHARMFSKLRHQYHTHHHEFSDKTRLAKKKVLRLCQSRNTNGLDASSTHIQASGSSQADNSTHTHTHTPLIHIYVYHRQLYSAVRGKMMLGNDQESVPANLDDVTENVSVQGTDNDSVSGQGTCASKIRNTKEYIMKGSIAAVLVGFIIFVIIDSTSNRVVAKGLNSFLEWIQKNPASGIFAFTGVYFLATVLFVPGSILTLGAGFVFSRAFGLGLGVLVATLTVLLGASSGTICSFIIGRYLLRERVTSWTEKYPLFKATDKAMEKKGFRIMALLRLSPIIPFNALNYLAGTTAITFSAYSWANLFMLPGTALYCFVGASAGSLSDSTEQGDNNTVRIVSIVVGVIFGIAAVAVTGWYAKKELNKITAEEETRFEIAPSDTEDAVIMESDRQSENQEDNEDSVV